MRGSAVLRLVACALCLQAARARIDVAVDAGAKRAQASGADKAIMSDKERGVFGLDDYGSKKAVEIAFGKWPTDVFLHSPTPWGDLYKNYNWQQVERTLTPTSAEILSSNKETLKLGSKHFENKGSTVQQVRAQIFKLDSHTVTHTWNKNADISSGIQLTYGMKFPIDSSGATMSVSYKNGWGNAKAISEPVRIGYVSGVKIKLSPGVKATGTLVADKEIMEVRVNYEASLAGQAALNYAETFKGHHFWGMEINSLMSSSQLPSKFTSTENLKIIYYSNAKIVVTDDSNQNVISEIKVPIDVVENFSNLRNYNSI